MKAIQFSHLRPVKTNEYFTKPCVLALDIGSIKHIKLSIATTQPDIEL